MNVSVHPNLSEQTFNGEKNLSNLKFDLKNIFICVEKMEKRLLGLEQHKSGQIMIEFPFWGELTL